MRINNLSYKERETLVDKIEKATEMPMFALVVIMIVALILPLVIHLNQSFIYFLEIVDLTIWAVFFIELSTRVIIAPSRATYLKKNWLDVLVVALPFLRVFRVLRILRFIRIVSVFSKFNQELKNIFSRHGIHYLIVMFIGIIAIGTVLIYNFDQASTTGIRNIAESLWLVVTIAFSGGFGDIFPGSSEAKIMAIIIIILGNVLVSYFTAVLTSYFTEKNQDLEQERIEKKLNELNKNIIDLKNELKISRSTKQRS